MSELAKSYESKLVEKKLYEFWERNNLFSCNPESDKPSYCIMIPPPNVTGFLHMGHALVNTLQDILIRWKRMQGYDALWMPGTDHAGIATQTVVERSLYKTTGKRRADFSREEFLEHVWKWKENSQDIIVRQLKCLGISCDWSRMRFTMDSEYQRSVRVMFKRLYDQGLIYRSDYLVNWDPVTQTALADDEVEYEDNNGFLWYFSYPLEDNSESLQIATTRPETMLGDVAVAVNPKDKRYRHLIGKKVLLPLSNRHIPIIADEFVEMEFGTGAVKITPAHDHNDYMLGQRHNLTPINILTPDGKINENGGKFSGQSIEEARKGVIQAMRHLGHFIKEVPHINRVGVSYRSKAVIEPYLSKQWFMKMSAYKDVLKELVINEKTKLVPKYWENTYFNWIDNLRDWCISRQLWWGHRIPIWYNKHDPEQIICTDTEDAPDVVQKNPDDWYQDPDVLDTWFSSSIWPFATLGWPENTKELNKYYPNSTLITGYDILFFWVARMMMMGQIAFDTPPFPETFLHGLIYGKSYWRKTAEHGIQYASDEERRSYDLGNPCPSDVHCRWEKMSKSKGNIIDPLEIIDNYGADACRMALSFSATHAREIDLDLRRFEEFRNFANKIWNGARFVLLNLEETNSLPKLSDEAFSKGLNEKLLLLEDHWILLKLENTSKAIDQYFTNYQFDMAAQTAYEFFWNDFCAYYVEAIKPVLSGKAKDQKTRENKQKVLLIVLLQALRLLHPMAPYITEELFQIIKMRFACVTLNDTQDVLTKDAVLALQAIACMVAPFPKAIDFDTHTEAEEGFEFIKKIIYSMRNARGEMKIPPQTATEIYITSQSNQRMLNFLQEHQDLILSLVKISKITFTTKVPEHTVGSTCVVEGIQIVIVMPHERLEQENARLVKEKDKLILSIEKTKQQMQNQQFLEKAPSSLIEKLKQTLTQQEKDLALIETKLKM